MGDANSTPNIINGIERTLNHVVYTTVKDWLISFKSGWKHYGYTTIAVLWILTYYFLRYFDFLLHPGAEVASFPPRDREQQAMFHGVSETDLGEVLDQQEPLNPTVILEPLDDIIGLECKKNGPRISGTKRKTKTMEEDEDDDGDSED